MTALSDLRPLGPRQPHLVRDLLVQAFAPDGEYLGAAEVDVLSKEYRVEEAVHEIIGATADGVFFVVRYEEGFFPGIRAFGVEIGLSPSR